MDWATIYEDGRVSLDGCVPSAWRLMAINATFAVIHSPGASWYDNGGKNYGAASIDVREIEELRPGNEPGTWRVKFKRMGERISFHPTPKTAAREAASTLRYKGDVLSRRIAEKP